MAIAGTSTMQPLYELSSQYKHWRYSKASLRKLREELNQSAVLRVRQKVEEEKDQAEAAAAAAAGEDIQYLSVEDELSLVTFYLTKVPQLCKAFGFGDAVCSTAMTYLKRFYTNNTCMDYHPKNVMLTCLFLATKTENQVISITSFTAKIKSVAPTDVLGLEFLVSQSLRFQFKVHHAALATYGMFLDLQLDNEEALSDLEANYPKVAAIVTQARLGDFEFLYTPSQIALAAFFAVDPGTVSTWLFAKQPATFQLTADDLIVQIKELAAELERFAATSPVDLERVREVDKRLRYCRNPEKDPNSALYKKHAAEAEAELNERRVKKAKLEELEDPFASSAVPESAMVEAREQAPPGMSALHPVPPSPVP